MDLDATDQYAAVDPADALGDVEAGAEHWERARRDAPAAVDLADIDVVVCAGMGGSGIAGDLLRALAFAQLRVPVVVHRGYDLPVFAGPRSLVVAFSHSGDTEETLSAFAAAGDRGARRLAITSGGTLASVADGARDQLVTYDAMGRPPRHSLPSLLVPALAALGLHDGLAEAGETMQQVVGALGRRVAVADNPLKGAAARLAEGLLPVVWGAEGPCATLAYRLRCQLNENAKMPAAHVALPEGDHNDVVAWEQPSALSGRAALIMLRDPQSEHERVRARFSVTRELIASHLAFSVGLASTGTSAVARAASLLMQADLLSVYTAIAADRDPTPVSSIDRLKAELGTPSVPA